MPIIVLPDNSAIEVSANGSRVFISMTNDCSLIPPAYARQVGQLILQCSDIAQKREAME